MLFETKTALSKQILQEFIIIILGLPLMLKASIMKTLASYIVKFLKVKNGYLGIAERAILKFCEQIRSLHNFKTLLIVFNSLNYTAFKSNYP